jgi:hypothetical protein
MKSYFEKVGLGEVFQHNLGGHQVPDLAACWTEAEPAACLFHASKTNSEEVSVAMAAASHTRVGESREDGEEPDMHSPYWSHKESEFTQHQRP